MKSFLCLCVLALSGHHGAAFVHRIPAAPPPVLSRGRALVQVAIPITVEPTQGPTGRERLEILVQRYVHACETKPFRTKGLSAAAVQGIGDVLSQHLMALTTPHAAFVWDARRTLTFVMIGLFYKGPALHLWYKVLGKIAHWTKVRKGFSETKQSLTALTVDQTVGVAIFYPLYYIMYEVFSSLLSFRGTCLDSTMVGCGGPHDTHVRVISTVH
jgi:protein Mpv17